MEQKDIRPRRVALGLTVKQLADYTGSSQQYLSQLEAAEGGSTKKPREGKESAVKAPVRASQKKLDEIDTVLARLESVAQLTAQALRGLPVVEKRERKKAQTK